MVDLTAGAILCGLARSLKSRGMAIELAELHDDVAESLRAIGAAGELGPIVPHRTIDDCLL
jgi:hypothetical protein